MVFDKTGTLTEGRFGVSDLLDIYATRIAVFREAPPPKNWDGVFVATSK